MDKEILRRTFLGLFFLLLFINPSYNKEVPDAVVRINRLSDQVLAVLDHYKSADPVGLPGMPIPDPMPIPEIKAGVGLGTVILKDQLVHGMSKFKIESVYSNLADMEMSIALSIDVLQVLGKYTFRTWLSSAGGASNTTLTGLYAEGLVKLVVAREGNLEASDIALDPSVMDIDVKFENPGVMGSILQGAMNSVGTLVLDAIKPYIMREVNTNILGRVNTELRSLKTTFPNSLSPLDVVVAEGRKLVRMKGFDPLSVKDFTHTTGVLGLHVTDIWVSGLATFHRVGNITVAMENNTVYMAVSSGVQQLEGKCNWEISMAGLISTIGKLTFTIEYLEVEAKINQSLDVRNRPNLEDLEITLGTFQLQFDGAGTLDYVVEAVVNILPNLLRYQIMLAIKEPLSMKIQEIFNDIDVEKTVKDQLQQLDAMADLSGAGSSFTDETNNEEGMAVTGLRFD